MDFLTLRSLSLRLPRGRWLATRVGKHPLKGLPSASYNALCNLGESDFMRAR